MPLYFAKEGIEYIIKKITGKDETVKFLNRLGIIEGRSVKIVSKISGDLIISIKDSRIALNRQLSSRILI